MVTRLKARLNARALSVAAVSLFGSAICAGCAFVSSDAITGISKILAVAFSLACLSVGAALSAGDARRARPALGALRALGHSAGSLSMKLTASYFIYAFAGVIIGLPTARFVIAPVICRQFGCAVDISAFGALIALAPALIWLAACIVYYTILRASPVKLIDETLCETSGIGGAGARRLTPLTAVRCAFFRYRKALLIIYCSFAAVTLISNGALLCVSAERAHTSQAYYDNFDGVSEAASGDASIPVFLSNAKITANSISADAEIIVADDVRDFLRLIAVDSGNASDIPAYGALITCRAAEELMLLPNDEVAVTLFSGETANVKVRRIVENYSGNRLVMGVRYASETFDSEFETNAFLARCSAPDIVPLPDSNELITAKRLMPFAGACVMAFGLIAAISLFFLLKTRFSERADSIKMLLACGCERSRVCLLFALDCAIVSLAGLLPAALFLRSIYNSFVRAPETVGVQLMRSVSAGDWLLCIALSTLVVGLTVALSCRFVRRVSPAGLVNE